MTKMTSHLYTSTHQAFIAVLGIQETCIKCFLTRTHPVCQFCDMIFMKEGVMTHISWRWGDCSRSCLSAFLEACLQRCKQIKGHGFFHHNSWWGLGEFIWKFIRCWSETDCSDLGKNFLMKKHRFFVFFSL